MEAVQTLETAAVLFIAFLAAVEGYYVKVEPHVQECFLEEVSMGTQFSLTFEVSEGGFLDIDVKIVGPNGEIIYQGNQETNGKYTFAARVDGRHKFCFSNEMSSLTPKVLMFSIDVGVKPQEGIEDTAEDHNNLDKMITQLSVGLTGIKHELEYMEVREKVHRAINDSTNSRVVLWAFFESLILVAMTLGQVYYLKRFFEVRRVV